jgi:hypothetical protein
MDCDFVLYLHHPPPQRAKPAATHLLEEDAEHTETVGTPNESRLQAMSTRGGLHKNARVYAAAVGER